MHTAGTLAIEEVELRCKTALFSFLFWNTSAEALESEINTLNCALYSKRAGYLACVRTARLEDLKYWTVSWLGGEGNLSVSCTSWRELSNCSDGRQESVKMIRGEMKQSRATGLQHKSFACHIPSIIFAA